MTRDTDRQPAPDGVDPGTGEGDVQDADTSAAERRREDQQLGDVDHTHPHTTESFGRTGVHDRGKHHPDEQTEE